MSASATVLGLVASMALIGPLLLRSPGQRQRWIPPLLALAIGVLAGDALLHLLPHAFAALGIAPTLLLAGSGFALFVALRRLLPITTSPVLGVATVVAILAHELPQELGDYAILVDAG